MSAALQEMPAAKPARKTRAKINVSANPNGGAPASSPIAALETGRQRGANCIAKPSIGTPLAPIGVGDDAGGGGQKLCETQAGDAPSAPHAGDEPARRRTKRIEEPSAQASVTAIVPRLVELQRLRRFCIVSQSRCDRSMDSLIASALGFHVGLEDKQRKSIFAQAKAFRLGVEKECGGHTHREPHGPPAPAFLAPLVLANMLARQPWDDERKKVERQMEQLARQLPVWTFVEGIKGLGAKGLAIIVGEAGIPIGDYRTVSGLWKRMGLAVINGERQRKKSDPGEAAEHGYSPKRRAEVWALCSDALFRAQWRGARDEDGGDPAKSDKPVVTPAHPIGLYGEVYARRRAHTEPRILATDNLAASDPGKWTKARCHNDARRIMTKALLADLWVEWRRAP